jgi:nucleoside-diphosphate-sugar epimerase
VIEAKLSGRHEIEIWGDGEQTRSFMYVDDCIKGSETILKGPYLPPLNLGSDRLISINGLVDLVEDIAGIKLHRTYNLDAPKGVRGRNSDNTLLQATIGWAPDITLETGLEQTYRWIFDEIAQNRTQAASA